VCKGAESFQVKFGVQTKLPPLDFIRAIRFVNPYNNIDLHRVTDNSSLELRTLYIKDELNIEFEHSDLRKNN
jgi:hypothetical protein